MAFIYTDEIKEQDALWNSRYNINKGLDPHEHISSFFNQKNKKVENGDLTRESL